MSQCKELAPAVNGWTWNCTLEAGHDGAHAFDNGTRRSSQPSSSSEINRSYRRDADFRGDPGFAWSSAGSATTMCLPPDMEEAQKNVTAARIRLESLYREQREQLEVESRRVEDWVNREAKLCPEDFGIEEYVHSMSLDQQQTFTALVNENNELRAALSSLKDSSANTGRSALAERSPSVCGITPMISRISPPDWRAWGKAEK